MAPEAHCCLCFHSELMSRGDHANHADDVMAPFPCWARERWLLSQQSIQSVNHTVCWSSLPNQFTCIMHIQFGSSCWYPSIDCSKTFLEVLYESSWSRKEVFYIVSRIILRPLKMSTILEHLGFHPLFQHFSDWLISHLTRSLPS